MAKRIVRLFHHRVATPFLFSISNLMATFRQGDDIFDNFSAVHESGWQSDVNTHHMEVTRRWHASMKMV